MGNGGRHVPGGIERWARLLGRWVVVGGPSYIIYEFLGMWPPFAVSSVGHGDILAAQMTVASLPGGVLGRMYEHGVTGAPPSVWRARLSTGAVF